MLLENCVLVWPKCVHFLASSWINIEFAHAADFASWVFQPRHMLIFFLELIHTNDFQQLEAL